MSPEFRFQQYTRVEVGGQKVDISDVSPLGQKELYTVSEEIHAIVLIVAVAGKGVNQHVHFVFIVVLITGEPGRRYGHQRGRLGTWKQN